jgi:hypothetical protein
MSTPIATIGFAPNVLVTRVSFTHVDHISFTLRFVFAIFFAMTDLTIACNCSMPQLMATSRTFSTWPFISGKYVSIA